MVGEGREEEGSLFSGCPAKVIGSRVGKKLEARGPWRGFGWPWLLDIEKNKHKRKEY